MMEISEFTLLISYWKEHNSSWKPNKILASQEISCTLWNSKIYYRIHKLHATRPYPAPARFNPYSYIPLPTDPI